MSAKGIYSKMTDCWVPAVSEASIVYNKKHEQFNYFQMISEDLPSAHECFRRSFTIDNVPESVTVHVVARSLYKFYVNGKFVMTGPARSPEKYLYADFFEICEFLTPGKNVIALETVYVGGITDYDFGDPGFACAIELDNGTIYSDNEFKYKVFNAYLPSSKANKLRAYPAECLDLNKIDMSWIDTGYDDSAWENVKNIVRSESRIEKRPFQMPELNRVPSVNILDCCNAEVKPDNEVGICSSDGYVIFEFNGTASGLYEISGYLPKNVKLNCTYMEWINQYNGSSRRDGCENLEAGISIIGNGGEFTFRTFHPYSCRYIKMQVENLEADKVAKIFDLKAIELCSLPSKRCANAFCSDPILNKIIEGAQNTLRVCCPDMYVDCSSHERRIYLHDSLRQVEAGNIFYGDTEISRQFLVIYKEFTGRVPQTSASIQNGVLCHGGTNKKMTLGHDLTWILQGFEHRKFTGEKLPDEFIECAEKLLYFIIGICDDSGFYVSDRRDICLFLDWSKMYPFGGVCVGINCLLFLALSKLGQELNDSKLLNHAKKIKDNLLPFLKPYLQSEGMRNSRLAPDLFISDGVGNYTAYDSGRASTFGYLGTVERSETTQYWLLLSGILNNADEKRLWEVLRERRINEKSRVDDNNLYAVSSCGLFGLWTRLDYALKIKDYEVIYRDIYDTFLPMVIDGNTFWESICKDSRSNAHGFNAMAGTLLFKLICGINPGDEGGYAVPVVAPKPCFGLKWGRGFMQLPEGILNVAWKLDYDEFNLTVKIPEGKNVLVRLPSEAIALCTKGGHKVDKFEFKINKSCNIKVSVGRGLGLREI